MVVQHQDGRSLARCVGFTTSSITGEQALQSSGIQYAVYPYGGSLGDGVCQVDYEPPTPPGGFTRNNCLGNPYWSTWNSWAGGAWSGAYRGVSGTTYADGDGEGFRYGDGGSPPPSPAGVCPSPTTDSSAPVATAPVTPPAGSRLPPAVSTRPGQAPTATTSATTAVPRSSSALTIGQAAASNPAATPSPPGEEPEVALATAPDVSVSPVAGPPATTLVGRRPSLLGWTAAGLAGAILVVLLVGQLAGVAVRR